MVMQARYEMQLEREASSEKGKHLSDMEREDYQKRIDDLLNAVTTLLNANNAMGEKLQKLEKIADAYDELKAENEKLKGELAMRKRGHYGKGSEKPKDTSESNPTSDGIKDEDEDKYIENGSKNDVPPTDDARKIESIPILNELDQQSALLLAKVKSKELKISSKLEHAINYMRNHWKELIAYIDIGNVLIDNNCCERAVRPFTNLRKSFGGFSSELGGEVAAAWLTFVESCKLQKRAALEVFNGYFQRIAEGRRDYDLITEEVLC